MIVPVHTYISVPLLAKKLNIELEWKEEEWQDFYYIGDTNIIDAAVLWRKNSYIKQTFMCVRECLTMVELLIFHGQNKT